VDGIVSDEANHAARAISLRVNRGVVVGDGGQQCVARLGLVFPRDGSVGNSRLKNRAVFSGEVKRSLQSEVHRTGWHSGGILPLLRRSSGRKEQYRPDTAAQGGHFSR